jgi:hypothetical protein
MFTGKQLTVLEGQATSIFRVWQSMCTSLTARPKDEGSTHLQNFSTIYQATHQKTQLHRYAVVTSVTHEVELLKSKNLLLQEPENLNEFHMPISSSP